jgi:hypothetical protein
MVKNVLCRPEFGVADTFKDDRFIISDTISMDSTWDDVPLPKHHKTEWNSDIVRQIMAYSRKSKGGTVLVLDDLISNANAVNQSRGSLLTKLFVQGRHHKVRGLIICTQKYNALPSIIREQSNYACVFKLMNKRERDTFFEDFAIEGIEEAYDEATSQRYGFLFIDKNEQRFYQGFEREL